MMTMLRYFIVFLSCWLAACALINNTESVNAIATKSGFKLKEWHVEGFVITTYSKLTQPVEPIHIYIEGDGRAWLNRYQASSDPTPHKPLVLQLAALDKAENVIYIARPCQYSLASSTACNSHYWTDMRYSEEVLSVMNTVLDRIKRNDSGFKFVLNGYSGGGAMAVLLAAQRSDVIALRTIAGNLDHEAVAAYHRVSKMPLSLNPIDFIARVQHIPQLHFIGKLDQVVPNNVAQKFVRQVGACAHLVRVAEASHDEGWLENWENLQQQEVSCHR